MLRPSKPGLVRHWYAAHGTIAGTASGGTYNTNVFATERFFSVYDQADFALETWVEVVLLRELASGRKLPAKFRPTLKRYAGPVAEVVR
jgi:hypothetical protein